ncbi:MAG: hypothetical protein AAFY34_06720 [Pseudomonadota bacterium]
MLILWLMALPADGVAQEANTVTNTELACSGGVRGAATVGPIRDAVTVSTIIHADAVKDSAGQVVDYNWPQYTQTILHDDGQILLRIEARGLFNNAGPLSCEERLAAAQRQLIEGLADAKRLDSSDTGILSVPVRMSQLSACLINDDACDTEPHYVKPSEALRTFGPAAFDALLEDEPLSFSVFVSDCQRDTYLYAPDSRTVLNVESTEC